MKKIYFLVLSLCVFNGINAQIVNIPDANFKAKLLSASSSNYIAKNLSGVNFKIDANNDGQIQVTEALQVSFLDVRFSLITSLAGIENFSNLKYLYCSNNQLSSLNINGLTNLRQLICGYNQLPTLNISGLTNLDYLTCEFNQLPTLNVSGLTNLQSLNCGNNQLPTLNVSGLTNLQTLNCGNNLLPTLDVSGLNNLNYLYCNNNLLPSLNISGLINLKNLTCNNNQITTLISNGFANLQTLNCSGNLLTNLDISNSTNIIFFNCSNNQISSITKSGFYKFISFDCSNNLLTTLDLSDVIYGNNDGDYFMDNNKLTQINLKNGHANGVTFSNNPNLKYICADDEETLFIQNLINQYSYINCNINSYCSFTLGGIFYTIQGNQKLDSNANGCDALDSVVPNLKFKISDGTTTGDLISNATGNYSIPVQAGTYSITPVVENPTYFNVSPTTANVTFPTQTNPFTQDFCISANGVHPDLEITILPLQPARPGFDVIYKIIYKNKGNTTQSGSVNLIFNDAVLDLVVANPEKTTHSTDNLSWDFTNLKPFETREITFTLNVNSPMETPAVNSGFVLAYKTTITSPATDETPIDNAFNFNQTVVNSFDPNDKTCLEGTTISSSLIGQYVHYLIRFENSGTFPAQNIVVKDMIDLSNFDISTLNPTNASHSYTTKISEGNKVEFIFENINLPFDDANNDGYIAFKIKTRPTLVVGDSFTNEASIFFDYNFPIGTNKATSTFKTLGMQDFEFSNYFSIYPIPANEILNITSTKKIEVKSIAIYDILGQIVLALPNVNEVSNIDVSNLKTGNYFVKINTDKGTSNSKFIKN